MCLSSGVFFGPIGADVRLDSQITEIIINRFVESNEPVLTVHDSYIVKEDKADFLQQTMAEATQLVVRSRLPAEHEGQFTRK